MRLLRPRLEGQELRGPQGDHGPQQFLRLRWVAGKKRARSGSGIRGALRPIRSRAAALQPITALCAPVARVGRENRVLGFAFTKRIRVFVRHLSALPHECSKGAKRLKSKSVVEAHGARIQISHGERQFSIGHYRFARPRCTPQLLGLLGRSVLSRLYGVESHNLGATSAGCLGLGCRCAGGVR